MSDSRSINQSANGNCYCVFVLSMPFVRVILIFIRPWADRYAVLLYYDYGKTLPNLDWFDALLSINSFYHG